MAKRVTNQQWCDLMNRVHSGRSCLTVEAEKIGITLEELIALGDETHTGGDAEREKEWRKTKRESSKRDKQMSRPRKRSKKSVATHGPSIESSVEPASELSTEEASEQPVIVEVATEQPMPEEVTLEQLLERKSNSEKNLKIKMQAVETAKSILAIRERTLEKARVVLEKAQKAFSEAETDMSGAQNSFNQAENELLNAQQSLQQVDSEIEDLKNNTVYLVDPWYAGTLPEFGTFFSTVEMEGITVLDVPDVYLPKATVDGILLFDYVPDYKKARVFVGLVIMHELEGRPYTLLVTDERVEALMKMNI